MNSKELKELKKLSKIKGVERMDILVGYSKLEDIQMAIYEYEARNFIIPHTMDPILHDRHIMVEGTPIHLYPINKIDDDKYYILKELSLEEE